MPTISARSRLLTTSYVLWQSLTCTAFTHTVPSTTRLTLNHRRLFTSTSIGNKNTISTPPSNQLPVGARSNSGSSTKTELSLGVDSVGNVVSTLFDTAGNIPLLPSLGLNAALFILLRSKLNKMLTPEGFAHALALGTLVWSTLGWRGWTVCVLYLFLGSAVTKVRFEEKEKMGIAEGRGGRRGPENVWGSAATALVCAACSVQGSSFLGITSDLYVLAYVSSLATKLADTFASEIGKAYGKTTFLITTLEKVPPGTEGAVSAEGTAAALFGGFLLPIYAYFVNMITLPGIVVAAVAAFLATNAESLIGATVQGKEGFAWMTNEVVNFFNTLIGAGLAIAGGLFLLHMV